MCDSCARLQRENRELREEIAEYRRGPVATTDVQRLQMKYGFTPGEARSLDVLIRHAPNLVPHDMVHNAISGENDTLFNIVKVIICRVKKKLPEGTIQNMHGHGYYIPADKLEALK